MNSSGHTVHESHLLPQILRLSLVGLIVGAVIDAALLVATIASMNGGIPEDSAVTRVGKVVFFTITHVSNDGSGSSSATLHVDPGALGIIIACVAVSLIVGIVAHRQVAAKQEQD